MSDTPVPMVALHERIDEVRAANPGIARQLRDISEEMPPSAIRRKLRRMAAAVEANQSSASIVNAFPDLCWILTMKSSTATAEALTGSLEQATYQTMIRNKRIRSVAYPITILMLAIGLLLVASAFVVPMFDDMYGEFGMQLPGSTEFLLGLSRFVVSNPAATIVIVLAGGAALASLLWFWLGESDVKRLIVGRSRAIAGSRQSLAKAATQLAELFDGGVDFERALRIAAESNTDNALSGSLAELAIAARQGIDKLKGSRVLALLPANFLVGLGITSTNIESPTPNTTMLRQLAASYQELSVERKDWTSFLIAQGAVIGVGLGILFVIFALFAPMVSLISALS